MYGFIPIETFVHLQRDSTSHQCFSVLNILSQGCKRMSGFMSFDYYSQVT